MARPPNIQTSDFGPYHDKVSVEIASPSPLTPTSIPSFHIDPPQLSEKLHSSKHRIRDETRKLLAHILNQLAHRTLPPPVYDAFTGLKDDVATTNFAAIAQTMRAGVGKIRAPTTVAGRPELNAAPTFDDEGQEDDGRAFSTDATLELMTQLRDVLIISAAQGWQIFDEGSLPEARSNNKSPFRISRNRNSLQPSGRRSRSPSPAPPGNSPELLAQCISVLASVVLEDCRFQTHSPRPTRPPNSLQAVILDAAQFLIHTHHHDPKIVSEIGFTLIPAFSSFPRETHARLLAFFEGVVRGILDDLLRARGPSTTSSVVSPHDVEPTVGAISIRVDQVQDEYSAEPTGPYGWVPWSSSSTSNTSLQSTNTPFQAQSVYQLSALIPPLLAAVLESIDVVSRTDKRPDVIHHFYRLIDLIVLAKPDAYLDILEVAAYHTPARRSAISLLSTFWPKAFGHLVVGKALPVANYLDSVLGTPRTLLPKDHPYTHQFVPWHFFSPDSALSSGLNKSACHSCSTPIEGFGLMCPFCMCTVHFGCYDYPEGSHVLPYSSDKNVQRVASFRFSLVLPNRFNGGSNPPAKNKHSFKTINLFTLCLCFVCRKPLWGCTMQGLRCMLCGQFVHSGCMSAGVVFPCVGDEQRIDTKSMTIDWSALRISCNAYYSDILSLTKDQLSARSHEEISIFSAILWTQLQIMTHGVSCGSIEIFQKGKSAARAKDYKVDDFELHRVAAWCEALLVTSSLRLSIAMGDYLDQTRQQRPTHGIMYNWSNLVYIASTIKSPYPIPMMSPNLLNVAQPESLNDETDTSIAHPFEIVPLAHLRDILGYELLVHSDVAASLLLSHIHHLGFFDRLDMKPSLMDENTFNKDVVCVFPIPLGLDLSTNVETLAAAVEACLADLDLSVNEAGFLLLVRKLWPNGMATEYSLKRLMRTIVTWILAEDDNLATILRDYLAKQRTLPGVRTTSDSLSWPSAQSSRLAPASSVNNGGDYVASRRALLNRYAVKWLSEMHDQDPALYGELLYDICVEASQEGNTDVDILKMPTLEERKRRDADVSDKLLKVIIRLGQTSGAAFSIFDTLFLKWLEHISTMDVFSEPMQSLYRLFPRETDASQRFSAALDLTITTETGGAAVLDPWRVVMSVGSQSEGGFSQSLQWLCAFARSGVDIPVSIFERFSSLATDFQASLSDSTLLVESLLAVSWLKPTGRSELQNVLASLHSRLLPHVLQCLAADVDVPLVLKFIRKSLGACLLLYGSDRNKIMESELVTEGEIAELPSRRKLNVRGGAVEDPIVVHPDLMRVLEEYVTARVDDVSCLTAKFLNTFLNDSPFLESYEVDNFVLRNGRMLTFCAWQFYDIQRHEISAIRTTFLLRVVVVDSQPLQELLHHWLLPAADWELRLLAVTRLFRIILDVTSPSFNIEGRQWRSSIIEVFYRYFLALWADEKEEVRLIADTLASGLLPAHLDAISLCWTESLATAPIAERVKLVSFLVQLRPYFPGWQVLEWDVIIDTLSEDEYDQKNHEAGPTTAHLSLYGLASSKGEVGVQSTNTDPDLAILRGSILLLSLQMIADGIGISPFDLQKIKVALAKAIGFADVVATPSANGQTIDVQFGEAQHIPEASLPCVNELLSVLDAPHAINMDLQGGDSSSSTFLVGSTLVDVSLNLFCTGDLLSLPIVTLKSLVESLGVIIYKHNFEHRRLKHLQPTLRRAVLRALELMLDNISYEIQQLALSVTQAFIKRWPAYTGSIIYTSIEQVSRLIMLQSHHSQDSLVAQAKSFIETTVTTYANNGFIMNLFKRRLDNHVFVVLKEITDAKARHASSETLRDVLLRDTFPRAAENDHTTFQIVLGNIQTYVEMVHHQGYSSELMTFVGQQVTALTRRALDLAGEGAPIDSAPLLLIPALLVQHNKANSREMLVCIDAMLRGVLLRLSVDVASLSRVIQVTTSLYRRTHPGESGNPSSPIILIVFEMLADALRLKARTLPGTLRSMLETIMTPIDHSSTASPATTHLNLFTGLVEYGFYYLQQHMWTDIQSENDFYASLAVGKMILQAASFNGSIYGRMSESADASHRAGRPSLGVRSWNLIVLAVLLDNSSNQIVPMFDLLSAFSTTHHAVLRAYTQAAINVADSTTDINHAYIAIKLWLLLAQRKSLTDNEGNATALMVWNELWPPFEAMIGILESDFQLGMSMTTASLTWSTVAELFIFLRCLRTPLALETSSQIATLNRLRSIGGQDSSMGKISRALKILSDPPPEIAVDILVNQAVKDVVAAEKVRVLEARRDASRATQGRQMY
ncbi:hypothetical protein B0H16DRAFT_1508657 [Mycena metata]|uniref:Phorbol-ester/DAG-type domain-containing protein n=1 Tax=Mycena metata TaxID=1033252 RepID=A0AAD7NTX7_9AGAR|nr:hypothetical protein B0H16DRAFT_1508657 [Mycena metata]